MKKLLLLLLFPWMGTQLAGQSMTFREVYDLHPGDEIGFSQVNSEGKQLVHLKVLARQEIGTDSLVLTYSRRTLKYRMSGNIVSNDSLTIHIGQLDSPVFKGFVKRDTTIIEDTIVGPRIRLIDSSFLDLCGIKGQYRLNEYSSEAYFEQNEQLAYAGLGIYRKWYYFESFPTEGQRDDETLEYFVKNGDTCGNTKDFPLDLHAPIKLSRVNLYPNPSSDILYIRGLDTYVFKLYNLHGQLLKQGTEQEVIHVEDLSSGLYFLELNGIKYRVLVEH